MALIEFKDYPNANTPIDSDNLNNNFSELNNGKLDKLAVKIENVTSDTDTYSCNYINQIENDAKNVYSTTEQVVGIWIDGKPLYRKVLSVTGLPGNTIKSIAYNITNLNEIWIENGFAKRDVRIITLPMVGYNGSLTDTVDIWVEKQENVVKLYSNSDWGDIWIFYVIINYTKTTD